MTIFNVIANLNSSMCMTVFYIAFLNWLFADIQHHCMSVQIFKVKYLAIEVFLLYLIMLCTNFTIALLVVHVKLKKRKMGRKNHNAENIDVRLEFSALFKFGYFYQHGCVNIWASYFFYDVKYIVCFYKCTSITAIF